MKLQFKYPTLGEQIKSNNSPDFKYALTQLIIGDMQTLRMLEAMKTLYSALCNHVIVVTTDRYKIECLDFVEVFSELTDTDKETRITAQWERVGFLAQAVACALSQREDSRIAIEWESGGATALLGNADRHG
jgi:hypothetical protein